MTELLIALVVVLALFSAWNLFLTYGLIRRLRESNASDHVHGDAVAGGGSDLIKGLTGIAVPAFSTTAHDGRPIESTGPGSASLFGFFTSHCEACHERFPEFAALATKHPDRVVAVFLDDDGDYAEMMAALPGVRTVLEPNDGPLGRAFQVRGYPAFARVSADGVLVSKGFQVPATL